MMDQVTARRRAKELGGIAVSVRHPSRSKKWRIGGWPLPDDVWIVVSMDMKKVLDDGESETEEG